MTEGTCPLRALFFLVAVVLGLSPTTAAAEPVQATVHDLTMVATFDKPSYDTGEVMTITVTVTNGGAGAVTAWANFLYVVPDMIHVERVGPFEKGERFTLDGGASITRTVTGAMHNPDLTVGTLYGSLVGETGETVRHLFTVPVTRAAGHVSGVVYYDKNRNRMFDAGEGQRDVTLVWENQFHYPATFTVVTDVNGEFRLDVPAGSYSVGGEGLGGLRVGYTRVVVDASGVDGLELRGAAPLAGLIPKVEFTKDTYAADEAPVVRVTLENTGSLVLSGVVATCNRSEMPESVSGSGWGEIVEDGVDLAPHSTVVFEVSSPMPARSPAVGYVHVGCSFGYRGVDSAHNRISFDYAAVPGLRGDLLGAVTHAGVGVAGVRLVLVPDTECVIVGETITGVDGSFVFRQLPVGFYRVYSVPPPGWRIEPERILVAADLGVGRSIMAVPGEGPGLPACLSGPAPGAGPAPAAGPASVAAAARTTPQAARVPTLADTGVSVLGPGVAGGLALLVGIGLVFVARRRPSRSQ